MSGLRMERILSVSIAVVVLCALPAAAAEGSDVPDAAKIFERASQSVVVIEATLTTGVSQGSGVVIGDGDIITNLHVVRGAVGLVTVRHANRSWRGEVTAVDEDHDLARVSLLMRRDEVFDLPAARFRDFESLKVGERVYAIGAPRGLESTLSDGLVSGLPREEDLKLIQTSAAISPGSSGGGLFDASARLAGITTLYLKDSQNLNFAIPADYVQRLAKSPHVPVSFDAPPRLPATSEAEPAATGRARAPEVPSALRHVRGVVVSISSKGPLNENGGLTNAVVKARVQKRLQESGIKVFDSWDAVREADTYAVLLQVDLNSLWIEDSAFYPWMITMALDDTSDLTDKSKGVVSIWSTHLMGYGGSSVVVKQVDDALGDLANSLAIDLLKARQAE